MDLGLHILMSAKAQLFTRVADYLGDELMCSTRASAAGSFLEKTSLL